MEIPGEKLLIKLWETIAEKGIGSLLSPWQTKRQGRAHSDVRRHELLLMAQAEADAADLRSGKKRLLEDGSFITLQTSAKFESEYKGVTIIEIEPTISIESFAEKGLNSISADAARAEINVSKAVIYAEESLYEDPQTPSDRNIDDDWLFVWRENAGRVTNEDLQKLWGGVLAGEIKSPGSYSIRTLDFIRTLSRTDAEQISKLAIYVIEDRIIRSQKDYLSNMGVTFDFLLQMQELGMISGVEGHGLSSTFPSLTNNTYTYVLRSHGKALIITHDDASIELKVETYLLTKIGKEILGLGQFEPDITYLMQTGKQIVAKGFSVYLADWTQTSENEGMYDNEIAIEA